MSKSSKSINIWEFIISRSVIISICGLKGISYFKIFFLLFFNLSIISCISFTIIDLTIHLAKFSIKFSLKHFNISWAAYNCSWYPILSISFSNSIYFLFFIFYNRFNFIWTSFRSRSFHFIIISHSLVSFLKRNYCFKIKINLLGLNCYSLYIMITLVVNLIFGGIFDSLLPLNSQRVFCKGDNLGYFQ